jgi:WD40 repeat protein
MQTVERFQTDFLSSSDPEASYQKVVRFNADGQFLFTGGTDKVARVWKIGKEGLRSGSKALLELKWHEDELNDGDFNDDQLATLSSERISFSSLTNGTKTAELLAKQIQRGDVCRFRYCR